MQTDISEQLERSFGDGPAHPPIGEQLAVGSRALRRRRGAVAAAACAVVVALGASYAVAASGSAPGTGSQVAHDPTPAPTPADAGPTWEDDTPIRYLGDELQVSDGVTVHEHVENPYGYAPPRLSDAFDLTYEGRRMWILATKDARGFGYSSSSPSNGWASFADWVADEVAGGTAGSGQPETVRLTPGGRVVAAGRNTIAQRTDDPQLGSRFAPPGTPTGAAVVQVDGGPLSLFVVWRVIDGRLDVITTPPRDVVGATFDELLTYARAQYASGEGLR